MKIRVLSDLHLELSSWKPSKVESDVTVLAGDIRSHTHALEWIAQHIDGPVMYVSGNPGSRDFSRGSRVQELFLQLH